MNILLSEDKLKKIIENGKHATECGVVSFDLPTVLELDHLLVSPEEWFAHGLSVDDLFRLLRETCLVSNEMLEDKSQEDWIAKIVIPLRPSQIMQASAAPEKLSDAKVSLIRFAGIECIKRDDENNRYNSSEAIDLNFSGSPFEGEQWEANLHRFNMFETIHTVDTKAQLLEIKAWVNDTLLPSVVKRTSVTDYDLDLLLSYIGDEEIIELSKIG